MGIYVGFLREGCVKLGRVGDRTRAPMIKVRSYRKEQMTDDQDIICTTEILVNFGTGDERHDTLISAKNDYEQCVSSFASIINFGKSAENLNACKAQIRKIDQQLDWPSWAGWAGLWP